MDIDIVGGRYVVAVSGGVDSIVLLELLRRNPDLELIVAHYDHGIREDSKEDRRLVQAVAKKHGLQFVYDEGQLGPETSEAAARKARYDFLHRVREVSKANGIITAHHQDDLVETAVLNLLRGTGRRGLTSLKTTETVKRPLLHLQKSDLIKFAQDNDLEWREDSTNQDTKYLRNYVRHVVLSKLSAEDQKALVDIINNAKKYNEEIDSLLSTLLHVQPALNGLDRHWFIMLPNNIANEVMNEWLNRHEITNISKKLVNKLVMISKTAQSNRVADVDKNYILEILPKELRLTLINR